ncbi:hypothetical protein I6I79_01345 [Enterococcus casseliflavus]|uniref:hypothetical protein n=1 Tax=Enterococcus casseliflavus TaxID=37734 RepID=UPI00191807EB|nr:hypothetical protein [Enterococcus casseliflavus]QQU16650.1 hypothetical protein I6I79_01345 [Enterococcus casseliflavus]
MNVSEEYKITAGTISGVTLKSIDIEPSIIVDGKIYTASEFNKAVEMLKQPQLNENQQIVLGQLKINAGSNGSLIKAIHSLFNLLTISSNQLEKDCTEGLLKSKNALARLTRKQAAEVLSAFAQWSLEQEEE